MSQKRKKKMKSNHKEGSKLNLKQIYSVTKEKKIKSNLKEGSKLNLNQVYSVIKEKKRNEI